MCVVGRGKGLREGKQESAVGGGVAVEIIGRRNLEITGAIIQLDRL